MNSFNKIEQYKWVLFLGSLYTRFISICSIPFEKIEASNINKKILSYYRNNPKKDYLILIGFILLLSILLFHRFIFGKYVFVYNEFDASKDCIDGIYPYVYYIFNNKDGLSWWSFNSGLGNNMFPIIMAFFVDPFAIIGSVFWNPIENGFIYIHILKLICVALVIYKLILLLTQNRYSALLTAILFSFNGFLMLWGEHYYLVNRVLYFLILIYALEIYLRSNHKLFLLFALILNLTDVFFFYQNVFFIGAYIIFRTIYFDENIQLFFKKIVRVFLLGILALCISAVFVFPSIYVLGSGPRVSTGKIDFGYMIFSMQTFKYYLTMLGRVFSNNLSGNGLNYFGYVHYMVAPQVYSGLLTLLLLPQIFSIKNNSHKKALMFLFILSIITLIFPFFAYMFTAFQELYYRWTYGIITLNIISLAFVIKLIISGELLNVKLLIRTFLFLMIILFIFWMYYRSHDGEILYHEMKGLYYVYKNGHIKPIFFRIFSYFLIYTVLIQLLQKYKVVVGVALLLVVSTEIVAENYSTFYARGIVVKDKNPFVNPSAKVTDAIKSNDKTIFYRIEKEYYSYGFGEGFGLEYNDALVHDYYGLKTYNTYNNKGYFDFCTSLELVSKRHWANVLPSWKPDISKRYNLYHLLSVKYVLVKKPINNSAFKLVDEKEGILTYENNKFLPLGFTYTNFIYRKEFEKLTYKEKDNLILKRLVLEDNHPKISNIQHSSNQTFDKFKIQYLKNSQIRGSIHSKSNSILFFSIPYDKGWEIKVNNKITNYYKVNIGFIGVLINKGKNQIELKYTPPFLKLGFLFTMLTLIGCVIVFVVIRIKKVNKS